MNLPQASIVYDDIYGYVEVWASWDISGSAGIECCVLEDGPFDNLPDYGKSDNEYDLPNWFVLPFGFEPQE